MAIDAAESSTSLLDPNQAENDVLDSFDVNMDKLREVPADDAKSISELDDMSAELAGTPEPTNEARTAKPVESVSGSSDGTVPDVTEALRQQAHQWGVPAEDLKGLDEQGVRAMLDIAQKFAVSGGLQPAFAPLPNGFVAPQNQTLPPGYGQQQQYQQPQLPQVPIFQKQLEKAEDGTEWDPKLVTYLNEMNQHYAQQVGLAQQQIAQQQAYAQQQTQFAQQAFLQQQEELKSRDFDRWIEQKGETFRPLFGGERVQPNSVQHRARAAVYAQADQMVRVAQQNGVQLTDATLGSIREMAAKQVLGEQYEYFNQTAQREPTERRKSQFISRANGQDTRKAVPTGSQKAADTAERIYREKGWM